MEDKFNINEYPNLKKLYDDYRNEVVSLLKQRLEQQGRKASGRLLKSIKTKMKIEGDDITIYLISVDYLKQTTDGRPPTKKDGDGIVQKKILKWIKDKHILPTPRKDKKGETYLPTQKQLAYLIARKIHKEGYEGDDVLYDVIDSVNKKYIPLMKTATEKDFIEIYSIKILKKINSMIKI